MKLITLILGTLLTFSAHASINDFEGHFTVVSGDTSYGSCQDFDVVYDTSAESLKVIGVKYNDVVFEFAHINKGPVKWEYDVGDVILKGTQKVVYDGQGDISKVVRRGLGFVYSKVNMTIEKNLLIITSKGRDQNCVLQRAL